MDDFQYGVPVPEPCSLSLACLGALALALRLRHQTRPKGLFQERSWLFLLKLQCELACLSHFMNSKVMSQKRIITPRLSLQKASDPIEGLGIVHSRTWCSAMPYRRFRAQPDRHTRVVRLSKDRNGSVRVTKTGLRSTERITMLKLFRIKGHIALAPKRRNQSLGLGQRSGRARHSGLLARPLAGDGSQGSTPGQPEKYHTLAGRGISGTAARSSQVYGDRGSRRIRSAEPDSTNWPARMTAIREASCATRAGYAGYAR